MTLDSTNSQSNCFRFWYHMYGSDVGTLNIYLSNSTQSRIWSLSGGRANQWYEGQVSYEINSAHQIIIEGIRGKDFMGGISVDDLTF
ncbi:unnamed protein product, partial [Didymodactylos carnosus]